MYYYTLQHMCKKKRKLQSATYRVMNIYVLYMQGVLAKETTEPKRYCRN